MHHLQVAMLGKQFQASVVATPLVATFLRKGPLEWEHLLSHVGLVLDITGKVSSAIWSLSC